MSPVTFAKDWLTEQVAENIKVARIRRGWSGRQLAERIGEHGVSHTWVSSRETGDVSCTLKDIAALAAALRMSEAELLGFNQSALVRSEAREVDEIIRNEDREYTDHNVAAYLSASACSTAACTRPSAPGAARCRGHDQ